MINTLKKEVKLVNMFYFVLDSGNPKWDASTQLQLKVFHDTFGDGLWKNLSVVYTRWGGDAKAVSIRE